MFPTPFQHGNRLERQIVVRIDEMTLGKKNNNEKLLTIIPVLCVEKTKDIRIQWKLLFRL
jgi:hypothetical protein